MALIVTFLVPGDTGRDRVLGTATWDGRQLMIEGNKESVERCLSGPVTVWEEGQEEPRVLTWEKDQEAFLRALPMKFTSAYLRAQVEES